MLYHLPEILYVSHIAEPFQCDDPMHPSHKHPTDCHKFYECTPSATSNKPHAVLKTCGANMMYNPVAMVCDWPASVMQIRPECGELTSGNYVYISTIIIHLKN